MAEKIGDDWVIKTWFNYTGDGDSGNYWASNPTVAFTLTAPGTVGKATLSSDIMLNSMPGQTSELEVFATGDSPDLSVSALETDEQEPVEGDIVRITTTIENNGEGKAHEATLKLFDGDPDDGGSELTAFQLTDVEPGNSSPHYYDWDTTGQTGNHNLHARIVDVTPNDIDLDNNAAGPLSIEVKEDTTDPGSNHAPEMTILTPDENDDSADEGYEIEWTASDSDGDGVTIDLYYDPDTTPDNGKMLIASGVGNTGNHQWNCSDVDEGTYYIYGIADDNNGSEAWDYSEGMVNIVHETPQENHDPVIEILQPDEAGDSADKSYTIEWEASDEDEDTITVDLHYDTDTDNNNGKTLIVASLENTESPGSYTWDTSSVDEGDYYILAIADDGNGGESMVYSEGMVTIDHEGEGEEDNVAPDIEIKWPSNGTTVKDGLVVSGEAADENGDETLEAVEIQLDDGEWTMAVEADGDGSGWDEWEYTIDTNELEEGWHTASTRAYDGELHSTIAWIKVFVDNIEPVENEPPEIVYFVMDARKYMEKDTAVFDMELLDENGVDDIETVTLTIITSDDGGEGKSVRVFHKADFTTVSTEGDRTILSLDLKLSLFDPGSYSAQLQVWDKVGETSTMSVDFSIGKEERKSDDEAFFESDTALFVTIGAGAALLLLGAFMVVRRNQNDWDRDSGEHGITSPEDIAGSQSCPTCGGGTQYSSDEDDHYCWDCEDYVDTMD